jgi:hypothetical protein
VATEFHQVAGMSPGRLPATPMVGGQVGPGVPGWASPRRGDLHPRPARPRPPGPSRRRRAADPARRIRTPARLPLRLVTRPAGRLSGEGGLVSHAEHHRADVRLVQQAGVGGEPGQAAEDFGYEIAGQTAHALSTTPARTGSLVPRCPRPRRPTAVGRPATRACGGSGIPHRTPEDAWARRSSGPAGAGTTARSEMFMPNGRESHSPWCGMKGREQGCGDELAASPVSSRSAAESSAGACMGLYAVVTTARTAPGHGDAPHLNAGCARPCQSMGPASALMRPGWPGRASDA